jgi:stage II sporulation protein R
VDNMKAKLWRRYGWVAGLLGLGLWLAISMLFPTKYLAFSKVNLISGDEIPSQSMAATNLIRLHVLANSDSSEDQSLKYLVRDAIVAELAPELDKSKSIDESRQIMVANLSGLEEVSRGIITDQGYAYPVSAEIGNFYFPTRSYGEFTLPAGQYEAVRVIIGNGEGANWWCVLFPPLCFINVSTGLAANVETTPINVVGSNQNNLGNIEKGNVTATVAVKTPDKKLPSQAMNQVDPKIRSKFWEWLKTIMG